MFGSPVHVLRSILLVTVMLAAACAPSAPTAPASGPSTTEKPAAAGSPAGGPTAAQPAGPQSAGAAAPSRSGALLEAVVAQPADPPTLDPQKPGGPFGGNLATNLFDPIAFYDTSGKLIPWLATEWSRVGEKQWRYKLRQNVTFTNGEPLDANAVKFTLDRMLEPGKVRQLYTFGVLEKIEVVDQYTFDVFTKQPDPLLPGRMTDLFVMPPKYTAEAGEDGFGQKPIGSGAFKLVEWLPNQRVVLEANSNYWQGKPSIDRLTFRTIPEAATRIAELMSGGVDIVVDLSPEQAAAMNNNPRARALVIQSKRVPYVGLNLLENGPKELKDKRVRQALNYAVDVDSIVKNILGGYGHRVATVFRPDFPGYDASLTPYSHDPAKAKKLLNDAGLSSGFSISLQTSEGIILKALEVSQAIASQLGEVGVKAEVEPLELNAFRSVVIGGQAQGKVKGVFLWNWGAKPGEADSAMSGFIQTGAISSYYSNPDVDKQILAARQAPDDAARTQAYTQLQATLKEEAPVIFLYQADDLYGVSERTDWKPRLDQYILGREITVKPK